MKTMYQKRFVALSILIAFLAVTPSAFADSSAPQEEEQSAKKIDYSLQLLVDGKGSLPARHQAIKEGFPIYLHSTIGGNPATGEEDQEVVVRLVPKVTSQGLELSGFLRASVGGKELENREISDVAQNGKVKVYTFNMNGKQYEVVLRASF